MARSRLRPAGFDDLGLRRALSDRLLPLLVGAMAFLAALVLAGAVAASSLAQHWQQGAGAFATVQVPHPGEKAEGSGAEGSGTEAGQTRLETVLALLRTAPGVAQARPLSNAEVSDLLRPWLGRDADRLSLPLPAVVELRLDPAAQSGAQPGAFGTDPQDGGLGALAARLAKAAPGTLVEAHAEWMQRLARLARSLQACAGAALLLVTLVAAAVIAVAIRAGLAARRDAIEIVHGLGATDAYIARRFAGRATALAAAGAAVGAAVALPVLLGLAGLAAPFATAPAGGGPLAALPAPLWVALPALPLCAAAIGWLTAQGTVRSWLRRLP